jgi:hypothetical protein
MASAREDFGVTQTAKSEVASEAYREEVCEVARLHDTRRRGAEREGTSSANVVNVAVTCKNNAPRSVASRFAPERES